MAFTGGYEETRLAVDMYRVKFAGNAYTSQSDAEDYVLLRAADVTTQAGYAFFAIMTENNNGTVSSSQMPGTTINAVKSVKGGYIGASTYIPGGQVDVLKPDVGLTIKCFKTKPADIDVFEASYIQHDLRKKHNLPNP